MPRPPNPYRSEKVHVAIPEHIIGEVRIRLFDPARGRVPHGRLSDLVTHLLIDWLKEARRRDAQQGGEENE